MTTSLERPPNERWWAPADEAVCAYTVLSRLDDLTYWSRRQLFTAADVAEGDDRPHVTHGCTTDLLERLRRAGYVRTPQGTAGFTVTALGRSTLRHLRAIQRRRLPLPLG